MMQNTYKRTATHPNNAADQFAQTGQRKRPCLNREHAHLTPLLSHGDAQSLDPYIGEIESVSPLEVVHSGESPERPRVIFESLEAGSSHLEEVDSAEEKELTDDFDVCFGMVSTTSRPDTNY